MIEIRLEGALSLRDKIGFLRLSTAEKRRAHAFIGRELSRAMKRAVRAKVESSPLTLFEMDPRVRRRKASSFARMVGHKANERTAVLMDRDFGHHGHAGDFREQRSGKFAPSKTGAEQLATKEQRARLRELGYKFTAGERKRMHQGRAGILIRYMEEKQGRGRKRKRGGTGNLMLLVWRHQGQEIIAEVDPVAIYRKFIRAKLNGMKT